MLFSIVLGDAAFARPCQFHLKPETLRSSGIRLCLSLFLGFSSFLFKPLLILLTTSGLFLGGKRFLATLHESRASFARILCVKVRFSHNSVKYMAVTHFKQSIHRAVTRTSESPWAAVYWFLSEIWTTLHPPFYRQSDGVVTLLPVSRFPSHGWHFANRPRSWNHSFLNLLESAVTIVKQKSAFSVSIRPFIRSVRSPHRGALRASTAAPSYWSCPTGSHCEKSAWIRSSECHSGGQRFPISTGLRRNWNKGHPISRVWVFKVMELKVAVKVRVVTAS